VRTIFDRSIIVSMIIGLLFVAACAKRPVAAVSQAPAPAPAPAPAAPPPAAPPPAAAPAPPPPVVAAPAPAPRPAPKDYRPDDALKPINFAFDSSTLRPADTKILDASAAWLVKNDYLLLIEGHCDERGTDEYNLALGDRRARSAMNYLVAHGVKGDRITIVSFGEQRPLCRESNEGCWSKNRRDMFLVKER
jgi:peptidoglycan-associated lipoprotein